MVGSRRRQASSQGESESVVAVAEAEGGRRGVAAAAFVVEGGGGGSGGGGGRVGGGGGSRRRRSTIRRSSRRRSSRRRRSVPPVCQSHASCPTKPGRLTCGCGQSLKERGERANLFLLLHTTTLAVSLLNVRAIVPARVYTQSRQRTPSSASPSNSSGRIHRLSRPPRHAVPLVGLVHAGLHHSLRPVREARASLSSPSRPSSASAHSLPPEQTRTCIRWRHQLGLLVIKVTDDKQVSHAPSHHGAHWN